MALQTASPYPSGMSEPSIPKPTRGYAFAVWATAVVIGVILGAATGLVIQSTWIGVGVGAVVVALVGISSVLAVRRGGRGTVEGAPPWTGDTSARHHSGAS